MGTRKLKEEVAKDFNIIYKSHLKTHLNNEELIGTINITYKYKNISLLFLNVVKNHSLSLDATKGLEAHFFWEVDSRTFNCASSTYKYAGSGGALEWYSIASMKEALFAALEQGLLSTKLDRSFEVQEFQFYMGDLGNFVDEANNYPANETFNVSCYWDNNKEGVLFRAHDS
jgi:hypothetical protein